MENVPAVMSPKHRPELDLWLDFLESLGYSSRMGKLNAKDFGVPQNRERAYVLSRLGAAVPDLPTGYGAGAVLDDILETDVPDRYLLKAKLARTRPDGQRVPDRCVQVGTAEGINGYDSLKRVYSPKGLAPTVTTGGGGNVMPKVPAGKDGVRKLTPRECWRLQGFPDWAYDRARDIPTSDSQLYKQAGNSIPVPVLTEIFKVIDKADIEKKEGKVKKRTRQTTLKSGNRRARK
ncbi:MAG: DNA cytosine methyltransferase, partial [Candidatus Methanomethylophilaceae archaeon]|nr:DNA cytosine methyltransferase [Candidatus Methanomethylophilaceae archaeon]